MINLYLRRRDTTLLGTSSQRREKFTWKNIQGQKNNGVGITRHESTDTNL